VTVLVVAALVGVGGWWGLEASSKDSSSSPAPAPAAKPPAYGAKLTGKIIDEPYPAGARAAFLTALPATATTSAVMLDAGFKVCQAKRSAVPAEDLTRTAIDAGGKQQDAQTVVNVALVTLCP
jgi:hypothetical protein